MSRAIQSSSFAFAAIFLLFTASYYLLLSDMPVDDMARYVDELSANQFFWDLGHVWLQPAALLIYRLFGRQPEIVGFLEALNVLSVALGAAVFFDTMRTLSVSLLRAAMAVVLLGASFNLLCLGPTAHIKLMVFPTLALALRYAVFWERGLQAHPGQPQHFTAFAAGFWIGAGANLLISVLPTALFIGIFMLVQLLRAKSNVLSTVRAVLPFAVGVVGAWLGILLIAYGIAIYTATAHGSFSDFIFKGIAAKQELQTWTTSWKEMPFRFSFSLIFNFVFLPNLGGLGRAILFGQLKDWLPYAGPLLMEGALAAFTGLTLLAIFSAALLPLKKSSKGLAMPFAFLLGAAVFAYYYNLNDPEHWFYFSLPIVLMAAVSTRRWLHVLVFGIWLPLLLVNNLVTYGIPKARFAMADRQAAVIQELGPKGLYIGFAAYPGEPDSSLLNLGGIERARLDLMLGNDFHGDVEKTLNGLREKIDATLARSGRVLVFRALDPGDWRGPVMAVAMGGLDKHRLQAALSPHYAIDAPRLVGGFMAWELRKPP